MPCSFPIDPPIPIQSTPRPRRSPYDATTGPHPRNRAQRLNPLQPLSPMDNTRSDDCSIRTPPPQMTTKGPSRGRSPSNGTGNETSSRPNEMTPASRTQAPQEPPPTGSEHPPGSISDCSDSPASYCLPAPTSTQEIPLPMRPTHDTRSVPSPTPPETPPQDTPDEEAPDDRTRRPEQARKADQVGQALPGKEGPDRLPLRGRPRKARMTAASYLLQRILPETPQAPQTNRRPPVTLAICFHPEENHPKRRGP